MLLGNSIQAGSTYVTESAYEDKTGLNVTIRGSYGDFEGTVRWQAIAPVRRLLRVSA